MKIGTQLAEELPKPQEGQTYTITKAEALTTQVRQFGGIRIELKARGGETLVEVLWMREVAGANSKLGSFITALGKDTDNWIGKKVKFVKWGERNRQIEVV
jgi:hypothetical protein